MSHPEQSVLDTIAELEAEENPDDITELVRWQLEEGVARGDHRSLLLVEPPYRVDTSAARAQLDRLRHTFGMPIEEYLAHRRANLKAFDEEMRRLGFAPRIPNAVE